MTATPLSTPEESLTELQRQKAYLDELPDEFDFPLFSGRQAIESQRRSGYKNTARAVRELIDNSVEAGARNVWIALDRVGQEGRRKGERTETVSAVAIIDDGPGMLPQMLRYSLSWGGGTHFKSPTKIGKFGFGLPNSSINQTRRVEVYSKTEDGDGWYRCVLDINDVKQFGMTTIPPAESVEKLPAFVEKFLSRKRVELSSGTVIVWHKPDRLTYSQASNLKQHLRHDFGVTYRGMLDSFRLNVEDDGVKKVDPLFLMPDAMFYVPPEEGGAMMSFDAKIPVRFWRDEETGTPHLTALDTEEALSAAAADGQSVIGTISVRVARFPLDFAAIDGDDLAKKRIEIRKPRRGIAIIRAGREIDTIDNLPTSPNDKASGLGSWPVLQGYDLHWAADVQFTPDLDDAFGIGNDKQTVRPIEDFWRVLSEAGVDTAISEERSFQRKEREERKKRREQEAEADGVNVAADAAAQAEKVVGAQVPDQLKLESQAKLEDEARQLAQKNAISIPEARQAIIALTQRKKYRIEFFEAEGGVFFKPEIGPNLVKIAKINTAHPFYKEFYVRLPDLGDPRARQTVDLLLLALTKAELEARDGGAASEGAAPSKSEFYVHEREQKWSSFMATALNILKQIEPDKDDEPDEN